MNRGAAGRARIRFPAAEARVPIVRTWGRVVRTRVAKAGTAAWNVQTWVWVVATSVRVVRTWGAQVGTAFRIVQTSVRVVKTMIPVVRT
jgi:hypothetical protein